MANDSPISGVSGISQMRMVFPNDVVNTYSSRILDIDADIQTQSTMRIATYVNCKTLPTNITGLNGLTPPDSDYTTNPMLGTMAHNARGDGSTIELFG
ncbi:MAG: hypothetical protein VZR09_04135 [Candidatus Gastranaerophilaceae bacterium]|nr:hypothetical protein [Candidatus Gastranaerophilaceae bacterium]